MAWRVKVEKQNGVIEKFDEKKVSSSIFKAAQRVGGKDKDLAKALGKQVVDLLRERYPKRKVINSDEIGNAVEKVLIENGHAKTAKTFILYREGQRKARKKLIKLKDLQKLREFLKLTNRKISFVTGVYDLLHIGHARYLKKASLQGDTLIVGLNSDESAKKLKGKSRPILGEEVRAEMISYLDFVDFIVIYPQLDAAKVVRILRPDVYVCVEGSWRGDFEGKAEVKAVRNYNGKIVVFPHQSKAISTSEIIKSLKENSRLA